MASLDAASVAPRLVGARQCTGGSLMNTYQKIKDAIINKKQVVATYNGHRREMCPHCLGSKSGREQALFYQFGGTSSSGVVVPNGRDNWRCIPIAGLADVHVVDGPWYTADNHSRPNTCVDLIDVEVQF